jgi:hypothetical protein
MFNTAYRKVLSEDLPIALRYLEFRHCLEWYCFLTKQSFQKTYLRIGRELGFDELHKPNESQLSKAAMLLNQERINFLQKLGAFAELRVREKARGRRQPRKAQLKELYSPDWLETDIEVQP